MSQTKPSASGRSSQGPTRWPVLGNSLFVKVKFSNNLPDLPFDPKFIVNPLDISRFVNYETTNLEQNSKHELITSTDLGVDIDLIQPDRYNNKDNAIHDPEDERLINDDEPLLSSSKRSARDKPHSILHNKVVPWLKKTEYISTEYNRYGSGNEKTETKVGYNVRKNMKEEDLFLDKDSQIRAINQTFEAAQKPIEKHPTKPGVTAERVLPVFPDYEMWKYFFAHVKFDSEPAESSKADQVSQAIVRGAYDEEAQENFVVYFLPTEVTMADRLLDESHGMEYTENKEYEYKSNREYTWSAKQHSQGDDFFFVIRDDAVYYNRLSMEVMLRKRRTKSRNATTTLVVKNREVNEEEIECQKQKLDQLKKPSPTLSQDLTLDAETLEKSYENMQQAKDSSSTGDQEAHSKPEDDDDNSSEASSASESSSEAESSSAESSSDSESAEGE